MAEYFKRNENGELDPIREEEPWEYMNDKIVIQDTILSEESGLEKEFKIKNKQTTNNKGHNNE